MMSALTEPGFHGQEASLNVVKKQRSADLVLSINMVQLLMSTCLLIAWRLNVDPWSHIEAITNCLLVSEITSFLFCLAFLLAVMCDFKINLNTRLVPASCFVFATLLVVTCSFLADEISETNEWKSRQGLHLIANTCLGFVGAIGMTVQGYFHIVDMS